MTCIYIYCIPAAKAIGVPGLVKGLHDAWLRYGRLPWADLIRPTIDMCRQGIKVNRMEAHAIDLSVIDIFEKKEEIRFVHST